MMKTAIVGVEEYLAGEWTKAKEYLSEAMALRPSDCPTKHLLRILEENDFEAPSQWPGYRNEPTF